MAIPFKKPSIPLPINVNSEIESLDSYFDLRGTPSSNNYNLILASWNIANLGAQDRPIEALKVIAHIMSRFDLIAVQEVNDDYRHFAKVVELMGSDFDFVMTDTAGNEERLAYVYKKSKVSVGNLFGELALHQRSYPKKDVKVHYRQSRQDQVQIFESVRFQPFDRNPFIGNFSSGNLDFVLANVHLYFGKFQQSSKEKDRLKYARRVLEIYTLAKWAKDRLKSGNSWNEHIVLLGDMNIPNMKNNEATISALRQFSWKAVELYRDTKLAKTDKLTRIGGSNLGNDKTYDQIAFAPTELKNKVKSHGVFDFDAAVFASKWTELSSLNTHRNTVKSFNSYLRFYLSDHRPIWVELDTT